MADSPTPEQIAADTHKQAIIDLAQRLNPEDGYETDQANVAASVFSLLVTTARVYADLSAKDSETADDHDMWSTLQGLAENLWTADSQFYVSCIEVDHKAKVIDALHREDHEAAMFHMSRLTAQRAAAKAASDQTLEQLQTLLAPVGR